MTKTLLLFAAAAFFEILGCWLVMSWMRSGRIFVTLLPALACLLIFACLLGFHSAPSGRVYAAYAGIYALTAFVWLWFTDEVQPTWLDYAGLTFFAAGSIIVSAQID